MTLSLLQGQQRESNNHSVLLLPYIRATSTVFEQTLTGCENVIRVFIRANVWVVEHSISWHNVGF